MPLCLLVSIILVAELLPLPIFRDPHDAHRKRATALHGCPGHEIVWAGSATSVASSLQVSSFERSRVRVGQRSAKNCGAFFVRTLPE